MTQIELARALLNRASRLKGVSVVSGMTTREGAQTFRVEHEDGATYDVTVTTYKEPVQ